MAYEIITLPPLSAEAEKRFKRMGKPCPQCKQNDEGLVKYKLGSATCIRCYECGYFVMNHNVKVGKKEK